MNVICELNDKRVKENKHLGTSLQVMVCAIVQNEGDQFAVIHSDASKLYSFPACYVNDGESPKTVLQREIPKKIGCNCDFVYELGIVRDTRVNPHYTQEVYYYAVYTTNSKNISGLSNAGGTENAVVEWYSFDEMKRLIGETRIASDQMKYIQDRNRAALRKFTKEHIGRCHLCGMFGKMSFEHIPPEDALNSNPVNVHNGHNILDRLNNQKAKYTILQQGMGKYSLCENCNNNTGNWYASEYSRFVKTVIYSLTQFKNMEHGVVISFKTQEFQTLAVVKQIVTMFCSLLPLSEVRRLGFDRLLLNRESNDIDTSLFDLRIYLTSREVSRLMIGPSSVLYKTETGIVTRCVSDLAVYPFGFILNLSPECPVEYGTSILGMFKAEYGKKYNMSWDMQYLERISNDMPLPLQFKPIKEGKNDSV